MGEEEGDKSSGSGITLYTVGHSNRSSEEFVGLLLKNGVGLLADIRKLPGSNKYPHFNQDELAASSAAGRKLKSFRCSRNSASG